MQIWNYFDELIAYSSYNIYAYEDSISEIISRS